MKGGHQQENAFQREEVEKQSTTAMVIGTLKNETCTLPLCSLNAPSTSSASINIARSTTTPLSQGKKYIDVQLLTREHLYLAVDVKCKIGDIYRYICAHIGLKCVTLFGLARYIENEYRFCDQDERLSKFAPTKNWQKAPGWGTDLVGNPSVILYLRVHTYVDYVRLLNCPVSLVHYYLQLRENVRIQWEPSWVPEERCFEAAALALQADFGDYRADKHVTGYFRPDAYFPLWVVNGRGLDYVLRHVPSMHHDLEGLDELEARVRYCREVSMPPCPVNMHLYGLRRQKTDSQDNVYLGITARGLELFEQKSTGERHHLTAFLWSKIGKLAFDRKKFTLTSLDGQKMVFYTSSDEKSRYLLNFCRSVHQNVIRLQPAICEARRREAEERKQFRESYIYSDTADLDWVRKTHGQSSNCGYFEYTLIPVSPNNLPMNSHMTPTATVTVNCGGGGQRVSLVSDASSNTTSGIVSDRQHTHDDSENENDGDVDLEITTACDSSPLVSELSLATTGTSPQFCSNGSQQSQQVSPVYESKTESTYGVDKSNEEADPGECSSSVGPCSDRTVTAAADDTQSTETTSTTGKLEDLCTESDLSCTIASNGNGTLDERDRLSWSPHDQSSHDRSCPHDRSSALNNRSPAITKATTPTINGGMSIAELRRLTLQDYADRQSMPQRRASPPILPPPQPPSLAMDIGQNGLARSAISYSTHATVNPQENAQMLVLDNGQLQNEPWAIQRPKAYRIVASQASNDGIPNRESNVVVENRTTPSPPRMDQLVVEPPPPPPYPYENDMAQSYSLSNLTSSSSSSFGLNANSIPDVIQQQQAQKHLERTSMDGLPNYEQALQYKAELGRHMAASTTPLDSNSNVPWLHTSVSRRWPTVSGIHPAVLDQLVNAMGARRLQQAQSEPGLAGSSYGHTDDYPLYRRCCNETMPPGQFANSFSPYALCGDPMFDGGTGAYRSISTYQLPTTASNLRGCTCRHAYDPPPLNVHPHGYGNVHAAYGHFAYHTPAPACTPNGLYVKQPRAQSRASATTSTGHRIHAADCQHSSQLLFNGTPNHGGSSKAVARVHSMYEAAKADHVRRSLEYEYYKRFEQQIVQNTRRELRKQQQLLAQSLNDMNCPNLVNPNLDGNLEGIPLNNNHLKNTDHKAPGHYCETCQENHTAGKLDLAQLKDIIRAQNVDLPLMRALCNDRTWVQQEENQKELQTNDSTAHPLLRQKKSPPKSQLAKKPQNQVATSTSCEHQTRPMTWHESFYEMQTVSSSSWPPYEFSYDH